MARAMTQAGAAWGQEMLAKPDIYGELGLVLAAMNMLPGVLSGMVLAAVLAAICSTSDSQLVVAASSGASNLYTRVVRRGKAVGDFLRERVFAPGNPYPWKEHVRRITGEELSAKAFGRRCAAGE